MSQSNFVSGLINKPATAESGTSNEAELKVMDIGAWILRRKKTTDADGQTVFNAYLPSVWRHTFLPPANLSHEAADKLNTEINDFAEKLLNGERPVVKNGKLAWEKKAEAFELVLHVPIPLVTDEYEDYRGQMQPSRIQPTTEKAFNPGIRRHAGFTNIGIEKPLPGNPMGETLLKAIPVDANGNPTVDVNPGQRRQQGYNRRSNFRNQGQQQRSLGGGVAASETQPSTDSTVAPIYPDAD